MKSRVTSTLPNIKQLTVADGNWTNNSQRGPIQSIVLHTMVGTVQGSNAVFNKPHVAPNYGTSAHYGIGLDGQIYQWCDEDNVAFHAGNWHVNQTSIGIEHEDGGDANCIRPDILYESSARLVAEICKFYEIPVDKDHIFRHHDVIDTTVYRGGTSCPDALDTDRIISRAAQLLEEMLNPSVTPLPVVAPPAPVVEQSVPVEAPKPVSATQPLPIEQPSQTVTSPTVSSEKATKVDQTDTNSVQNTPSQTNTTSSEPNQKASGQAGKVPENTSNQISPSIQPKFKIPDWIIHLIVLFFAVIGIETKDK